MPIPEQPAVPPCLQPPTFLLGSYTSSSAVLNLARQQASNTPKVAVPLELLSPKIRRDSIYQMNIPNALNAWALVWSVCNQRAIEHAVTVNGHICLQVMTAEGYQVQIAQKYSIDEHHAVAITRVRLDWPRKYTYDDDKSIQWDLNS